jgi:phosphoglycolate phosphatase
MRPRVQAVLFDLDGTLIDSAPDLAGRLQRHAPSAACALPYETLARHGRLGARGMVGLGFGRARRRWATASCATSSWPLRGADDARDTRLRTCAILDALRLSRGVPWGIVTNKATRFAEPLVRGWTSGHRPGTGLRRHDPARQAASRRPLLEAARRMKWLRGCVYVGDDRRDVDAGRAAACARSPRWGYLGQGEPAAAWGADAVIERPAICWRGSTGLERREADLNYASWG